MKANNSIKALWEKFANNEQLSKKQEYQFRLYEQILTEWNKKFNLTAVTDLSKILSVHFQDSLKIGEFINFNNKTAVDIGTGGGFPGIPLKIKYPNVTMILLEVSHKKKLFLEQVIAELELSSIQISSFDWRTFLRKTSFDVDYFLARASLSVDELLRMFKPSCPYKNAQLIYWASKQWQLEPKQEEFFEKEKLYKIGTKERRFVFFKLKN